VCEATRLPHRSSLIWNQHSVVSVWKTFNSRPRRHNQSRSGYAVWKNVQKAGLAGTQSRSGLKFVSYQLSELSVRTDVWSNCCMEPMSWLAGISVSPLINQLSSLDNSYSTCEVE